MPPSTAATPPAGRVGVVSAVLVAALILVGIASGPPDRDDTSFRAGYTAVSDPGAVRAAMATPGMTPSAFCDGLARTLSSDGGSSTVVAVDFLAGCRSAVADAME